VITFLYFHFTVQVTKKVVQKNSVLQAAVLFFQQSNWKVSTLSFTVKLASLTFKGLY